MKRQLKLWVALAAFVPYAGAQSPGAIAPGVIERFDDAPEPPPAREVVADAGTSTTVALAAQDSAFTINVSDLLNKHQKNTALKMIMGKDSNITVFVSGQFNRDLKTGFAILHSNRFRNPLYFDIKALLDNEIEIELGGVKYKLLVDASITAMKSEIKIIPQNGAATFATKLGALFDSTFNAGQPVQFKGVEHRVFYYNQLAGKPQAQPDPALKNIVLLSRHPTEKDEYYTYVLPEERLNSETDTEFTFKDNPIKKLKARLKDGVLQVRAE